MQKKQGINLLKNPGPNDQSGFTLFELVLTLGIVALVSVMIYPYYGYFLLKSHRTDARTSLTADQLILERCYARHFAYTKTCALLPSYPHLSRLGFYNIDLIELTKSTYTLTATPTITQIQDITCSYLTVNQSNINTAVDELGKSQKSCWQQF